MAQHWLFGWLQNFIKNYDGLNKKTTRHDGTLVLNAYAVQVVQQQVYEKYATLAPSPKLAGSLLYLLTKFKPIRVERGDPTAEKINQVAGILIGAELCGKYLRQKTFEVRAFKVHILDQWAKELLRCPQEELVCILIFDLLYGGANDQGGTPLMAG